MKKILISAINIYQIIFSTLIRQLLGVKDACRFYPTCSDYAKESVLEKGVVRGTYLSFVRILKCQPFYNKNI